MQTRRVQERLSQIERTIDAAVLACRADSTATPELLDCIGELGRGSDAAMQLVRAEEPDQERLRDCIDELEKAGDRAVHACRRKDGHIGRQLRDVVQRAHNEISDLKHQMH